MIPVLIEIPQETMKMKSCFNIMQLLPLARQCRRDSKLEWGTESANSSSVFIYSFFMQICNRWNLVDPSLVCTHSSIRAISLQLIETWGTLSCFWCPLFAWFCAGFCFAPGIKFSLMVQEIILLDLSHSPLFSFFFPSASSSSHFSPKIKCI